MTVLTCLETYSTMMVTGCYDQNSPEGAAGGYPKLGSQTTLRGLRERKTGIIRFDRVW